MNQEYTAFRIAASNKAFDLKHRDTIAFNISKYDRAFETGKEQFLNLSLARKRAAMIKHTVLEHLEDHLKDFEQAFTSRGGKLIWARDAADACSEILKVLESNNVKMVVKSKSMITEEINLNTFLEKNGVESIETDLGEYIVQITNDKPYHIVTPIMHRSAEDVAAIFHEKFGLSADASPEDIVAFVRSTLRDKFLEAGAGITGANFLVSGSGSVAVTENEGNAVLSMSLPKIHIVIAGIEKIIPSLDQLELFWPLLATYGTGQRITAYNTLIQGPRQAGETDGPTQVYVVLLDNGRSRLLATTPQRRALSCIKCGACLNACPVYRTIGGHSYGTVYTGPIGAIISPHLSGKLDEYKHLSFASTLCGKCTEVCPVNIDLHYQLLRNRKLSVEKGHTTPQERRTMWLYRFVMKKRSRLDAVSPGVKNYVFRRFFGKLWGERRELMKVKKSFSSTHGRKL